MINRHLLASRFALAFSVALLLTSLDSYSASAQNISKTSQLDSTVTVSANGDVQVRYFYPAFDYGALPKVSEAEKRAQTAAKKTEIVHSGTGLQKKATSRVSIKSASRMAGASMTNYAVGEIPLQEGVTPSGGKMYQIPIATASGYKLTPSVAVCYNSQAGEGAVGFGWDISGTSSITLINKNKYYHGVDKGANKYDKDAVFALDGVPLVQNTQSGTQSKYPLITASGNILVAPNRNSQGYVASFSVLYPDGSSASFAPTKTDNSCNQRVYPISQMSNKDGEKITFHYLQSEVYTRLTAIRYGYNVSGQYKGELLFSYDQTSYPSMPKVCHYFAGHSFFSSDRLLSIISRNNGETLYTYTFSYEEADGVSLLSRVECAAGNESLPPLQFEYGATGENVSSATPHLYQDERLGLPNGFEDYRYNYVYKRGKFVSGSNNDGLIIYPRYENYGVIGSYKPFWTGKRYLFGSLYPENQQILFAPSLKDFSGQVETTITTGEGFQTIEAVDVDGDGIDELVKVNFNGTSDSNTRLLITVYKCDSSGRPVQNARFEVQVKGTIIHGDYNSPYRREYYWGDFRGNGKIQLLTVAYDKNYNDTKQFDQESYAAVIDISAQRKLCDSKLFDFSKDKSGCLLVCDLDNDSQTEMCFGASNGLDVYRLQSSLSFGKEKTVSGLNADVMTKSGRPYYVTDLNGDGYIDIVLPPSISTNSSSISYIGWDVYRFDGNSFSPNSFELCSRTERDEFWFLDVNQDGFSDLVKINGNTLGTYINRGGYPVMPFQESPSSISLGGGTIPANVVNFLGENCFIKVHGTNIWTYRYSALSPRLRQLTKSTDSYGRTSVNSYAYLPEKIRTVLGLGWWDTSLTVSNADGYVFKTLPIYVLEKEESYLAGIDSPGYKSISYAYFNAVIHNQGLGFCGFSKIRSTDSIKSIFVEEIHDPEKRGVTTSSKTYLGSYGATPFSTVTNTYDNNSTTYGKLNPRLTRSVVNNTLTGITATTSYTYGSYDLPTQVLTSRRIGSGTAQTELLTRTYQNTATSSKYILGLVTEESVVKDSDGDLSLSWKERIVNTYDSYGRLLTQKKYVGPYGERPVQLRFRDDAILTRLERAEAVAAAEPIAGANRANVVVQPYKPRDPLEPGDPTDPGDPTRQLDPGELVPLTEIVDATNLVSETRWQYDSFGNVTSEKTASYGATTFLGSTYTYDSDGRYLLTETDALGHATTYSDYNKFGAPATVKDYRNRTTTYVYDAWGSVTKKTSPDGTVEQSVPAWGGAGLYTVTSTITGKPQTVVHYDALGREVRTDVKRFNDQWQYVSKVYDNKGHLQKVSLPYRGASATYWSNYAYDGYDRPTSLREASGKVTVWAYNGANTTTVKDGIPSTSTIDASGNVIRVVDAGGTITYTLRDDGQPASITAPGNVITTFTYDDYGRRTKIVDPSAGTETDSYVWNSDGSSVQTHVGPNGTVKTYVDKYGRTTKIERPGEYTTTYTYSSYNLLTKEQSTNGTSTEYTYDAQDRLSTSKETVPDGKWLKKTYTYTSGSVLSKIAYEAQSGTITTETYTYANGYNTEITLADGTIVRNLTSENDLGMPTAITSGSITREYGYTAFGMPTYRRMGTLQDMRYQFDPQTGNLTMRRDETRDKTESFTYDNLNRLTSIGTRQITYADNGNILSMGGVGSMSYGSSAHPYQITSLTTASNNVVANRAQSVSYTCYSRPSVLTEGSRSAAFTYNGDGDRVKMYVANGSTQVLTRYYIGGQYEFDQTPSGTKERLYVGGDAYSAPMVYQREGSGSWTAYNIGRDYLGNITHIATASGTLVAEYSYDPWGRLRDPSTLSIYAPGNEPELFLGRGFTGHEHLTWFGLINMNARLYDPVVGRFLSPDPYVQAPDFTQNFNRYSYALNNPLRYVDQNGEWLNIVIGAIIGGISNLITNWGNCDSIWEYVAAFGIGAAGGALSAAGGACLAGALKAATGVGAGALTGALVKGATSAVTSFATTAGNNLIAGNRWDANGLWKTVGREALKGALSGAFSGGITGGKNALKAGKNVWWGSDVKYGRTQWSLNPAEKPYATVKFDVKNIGINANDCVPATFTEINDFYGGKFSYSEICDRLKYQQDIGVTTYIERIKANMGGFFQTSDFDLSQLGDAAAMQSLQANKNLVTILMKYQGMSHLDNVRAIKFFSNKVVIQLRVGSMTLDKLKDCANWGLQVSGLRY